MLDTSLNQGSPSTSYLPSSIVPSQTKKMALLGKAQKKSRYFWVKAALSTCIGIIVTQDTGLRGDINTPPPPSVCHKMGDDYLCHLERAIGMEISEFVTVELQSAKVVAQTVSRLSTTRKMEDDYLRHLERASEMAKDECATVVQKDVWDQTFVGLMSAHEMVAGFHRHIVGTSVMVKDERLTVAQESPDGFVSQVLPLLLTYKKAGVPVAHERVYRRRIDDLREMAEDEGFTVAEASIKDLWIFFSTLSPSQKAELAVNPNENLRAIWDDDHGNHVGIQFRGAGVLQYVIFKGPADSPERIYDAGRGDIGVVRQRVKDFNLENLLGIYGV